MSETPKVPPPTDCPYLEFLNGKSLHFEVKATCGRARSSVLTLPHAQVQTPVFMPVGTNGAMKGLTPDQMESLGCKLLLGNTYHIGSRFGAEYFEYGQNDLHHFENWKNNILTDSGGFQMVSLLKLCRTTEEGVVFQHPHNGSELLLTPEHSIELQNSIGADIMMALDDVVSSLTTGPRVEEAMHRTLRWIDRCIAAHKHPETQNLFGIVQGGLQEDLRRYCTAELAKRDLPGYAIGGLSGGESKHEFWKMIKVSAEGLPANKPRYAMGVGYAEDLVVCVALGVDMFDCVFPTRTARFGTALRRQGSLNLKNRSFQSDLSPIDDTCQCYCCKNYTRAYLHASLPEAETLRLVTIHNVAYQFNLMADIKRAIEENAYPQFCKEFFKAFHLQPTPTWIVDALNSVNISL